MLCIDVDGSLQDHPERDFVVLGAVALACAQRPEPHGYRLHRVVAHGRWVPIWLQDGLAPELLHAAAQRLRACAACAFLCNEMHAAAHGVSWPFHECGRLNPAPAAGPCPAREDGAHQMRRRFAGELLITDCGACGMFSPDSD